MWLIIQREFQVLNYSYKLDIFSNLLTRLSEIQSNWFRICTSYMTESDEENSAGYLITVWQPRSRQGSKKQISISLQFYSSSPQEPLPFRSIKQKFKVKTLKYVGISRFGLLSPYVQETTMQEIIFRPRFKAYEYEIDLQLSLAQREENIYWRYYNSYAEIYRL